MEEKIKLIAEGSPSYGVNSGKMYELDYSLVKGAMNNMKSLDMLYKDLGSISVLSLTSEDFIREAILPHAPQLRGVCLLNIMATLSKGLRFEIYAFEEHWGCGATFLLIDGIPDFMYFGKNKGNGDEENCWREFYEGDSSKEFREALIKISQST